MNSSSRPGRGDGYRDYIGRIGKLVNGASSVSSDGKVDRSKLPDEYGYLASEWSGQIEVPIVLLEKIH